LPKKIHVSIGFVGKKASTFELLGKMKLWRRKNKTTYAVIIDAIGDVVERLIQVIQKGALLSNDEQKEVIALVEENRALLQKLSTCSGLELETPELKLLADIVEQCGGAGKFSGAGGGDCGIAICFKPRVAQAILSEWRRAGFFAWQV